MYMFTSYGHIMKPNKIITDFFMILTWLCPIDYAQILKVKYMLHKLKLYNSCYLIFSHNVAWTQLYFHNPKPHENFHQIFTTLRTTTVAGWISATMHV